MNDKRNIIFGRLLAIATVLGDRVFDKKVPSISSIYMDKIGREPAKTIEAIHRKLLDYAHKFGPEEIALLDMFGDQISELDMEDFDNIPLDKEYQLHYYKQKADMFVGVAEAAEIMGWTKQYVSEYRRRGLFPEPMQLLASGPIWFRQQILDYKATKESNRNS